MSDAGINHEIVDVLSSIRRLLAEDDAIGASVERRVQAARLQGLDAERMPAEPAGAVSGSAVEMAAGQPTGQAEGDRGGAPVAFTAMSRHAGTQMADIPVVPGPVYSEAGSRAGPVSHGADAEESLASLLSGGGGNAGGSGAGVPLPERRGPVRRPCFLLTPAHRIVASSSAEGWGSTLSTPMEKARGAVQEAPHDMPGEAIPARGDAPLVLSSGPERDEAGGEDAMTEKPCAGGLGAELSRLELSIAELEAALARSGAEFEPEEGDPSIAPGLFGGEETDYDLELDWSGEPEEEEAMSSAEHMPPDSGMEDPNRNDVLAWEASAGAAAQAGLPGAGETPIAGDEQEFTGPEYGLSPADKDVLRAIVTDVIREEMGGILGERISGEIRTLLQQELQRLLSSGDVV